MKIKISNFRGIEDITIPSKKLNVITAPNGHGKSSIIDAIYWFITGKINNEDIRIGANEASVTFTFEDGNVLTRTRNGKGVCIANEQKVTEKVLEDMIKNELKCSLETATALCGTDFLDSLNKKDLTAFLLSILPIRLKNESVKDKAEETLGKKLLPDEEKYLATLIQGKTELTLDDLQAIYTDVYAARKVRKQDLAEIKEKAKFDDSILPTESKETLQKQLEELAVSENSAREYQQKLSEYNKVSENIAKLKERKKVLDEIIDSYKDLKEPNEADYKKALDEKKQFEDAVSKYNARISFDRQKLDECIRNYQNLQNPVCPLTTEKCSADLTPYKDKIAEIGEKYNKELESDNAFVQKCNKEISDREAIIKYYNDNIALWQKVKSAKEELANMIMPELPKKPEEIKLDDIAAKKQEINTKLNIYTAFEQSQAYNKQVLDVSREVEKLEMFVKLFDVKGIRTTLLKKALAPIEQLVNKNASSIRQDFKISLIGTEGLDVNIYPDGKTPVPIEKVSSGEFILTAYLIMGAVHDITGASFLVIDDMDRLDKENANRFMTLIENDNRFKNVILAGVNHEDFVSSIPKSANIIKL